MRIAVFGTTGKLGSVVSSELQRDGHEIVDARHTEPVGCEVGFEATRPGVATRNISELVSAGLSVVIATSNVDAETVDRMAREADVPCLYAPNFALGAVLMMKFAVDAAARFPHSEIVECHDDKKVDAPSGTANATAAAMRSSPTIHSIRLPGFISRQAVIFGSTGELLVIEHETSSYLAFVPGVRLALARVRSLPPGLTIGLESVL
jgi:4-hydroxy-tetrahydrodipicolinate reductase